MLVVQEDGIDAEDLAGPLDVDLRRAIDHDLGDRFIVEERLQRPETGDVIDHLEDQAQPFIAGHDETLRDHHPVDECLDLGAGVGRRGVDKGVEGPDDLLLEAQPDIAQELFAFRGP